MKVELYSNSRTEIRLTPESPIQSVIVEDILRRAANGQSVHVTQGEDGSMAIWVGEK